MKHQLVLKDKGIGITKKEIENERGEEKMRGQLMGKEKGEARKLKSK